MNKTELISGIANNSDMDFGTFSTKAVVTEVVNTLFETIACELESGGNVAIMDFGTFSISERAAREGRNPATGESIEIDAKKVVKFKPGKELKERVA